jgi:hypothetical protein
MTQSAQRTPEKDKEHGDIEWKCANPTCESRLALIDEKTKREIRVKYKDLYILARNPELIRVTCRACGLWNEIEATIDAPEVELAHLSAHIHKLADAHPTMRGWCDDAIASIHLRLSDLAAAAEAQLNK